MVDRDHASSLYSVSVVIPVYNRKEVLVRAIRSVLEQSLHPESIIVVDDASDFDIASFLQEQGLSQVMVIRNETNQGGAQSRNVGADHANSRYIAFLDSDDYWLPDKLMKEMEVFKAHPETDLVYCDTIHVNASNRPVASTRKLYDDNLWDRLASGWTAFPNTSSLVIRKDTFINIGKFDATLSSCQDHDLWMRIGKAGTKVRFVDEPLYHITSDANNRITLNYPKRVNGVQTFLSKWRDEIIATKGAKGYRAFRNQYLVKTLLAFFFMGIKQRNISFVLRLYFNNFMLNDYFYKSLFSIIYSKLPL